MEENIFFPHSVGGGDLETRSGWNSFMTSAEYAKEPAERYAQNVSIVWHIFYKVRSVLIKDEQSNSIHSGAAARSRMTRLKHSSSWIKNKIAQLYLDRNIPQMKKVKSLFSLAINR